MPTDDAARERGRRWLAVGFQRGPAGTLWLGRDGATWRASESLDAGFNLLLTEVRGRRKIMDWLGWQDHDLVPDDRDPATLGVMVAQTRERWGNPGLTARYRGDTGRGVDWWIWEDGPRADRPFAVVHVEGTAHGPMPAMGPTEAAAWLAAFEAGPR